MTRGVHAGKLGAWCRACGSVASLKSRQENPERARKRVAEWARQKRQDPRGRTAGADLIGRAVRRAREAGLPFDDSVSFRDDIVARVQRGYCELTGIPFNSSTSSTKKQGKPFRPSLDRIVPHLGYVPGNVRVVLWAVNAAIGSWGLDVAREIAAALVARVVPDAPQATVAEPSWSWN